MFRALWLAALGSNIGNWMQNVAAAWLMTSLTTSAVMVTLVQTATVLPVFLVAIPAGALADVVDRRKLLLIMQCWMALVAVLLGVLTITDAITPWSLLLLTFALGLGAAMNAPAWQAVTADVVPREQLPSAIALNAAGFNVARAIGPALGGLVVAVVGAGAGFLTNAASFAGVTAVLYAWRAVPRLELLPAERLTGAIRAGIRYVRHAGELKAVLARSGSCLFFGTAVWALLPIAARDRFGLGVTGYGILLGCLGGGAVVGAGLLSRVRASFGVDAVVTGSTVVFAAVTAACGVITSPVVAGGLFLIGGMAWIGIMSSFNVSAQLAAPGWVKARALGAYMLVSQGAMAVGSALWGVVAGGASLETALFVAAGGMAATCVLVARYPLAAAEAARFTPSLHWPDPELALAVQPDDGPVLVTVEYCVDADSVAEFIAGMHDLCPVRRRYGAEGWGLFRDLAEPNRFVETFLVESWADHLRQHARVTVADQDVEARTRRFHRGEGPKVSHLLSATTSRTDIQSLQGIDVPHARW